MIIPGPVLAPQPKPGARGDPDFRHRSAGIRDHPRHANTGPEHRQRGPDAGGGGQRLRFQLAAAFAGLLGGWVITGGPGLRSIYLADALLTAMAWPSRSTPCGATAKRPPNSA